MTSVIAALSFGGEWHIHDKDAIKLISIFLKLLVYSKMKSKKKLLKLH